MGTIEQKVDYLKETKQAIRTAIEEKGVSVADTDTFRSYASKIGTISVGGGGTKWYVGDFYDGQMYEGNNGDLFLNTGTTDQGTILQFTDGTWNPVGNLMGPQGSQGAQGLSGASEPVGSIILWGGDSVPDNYLPCVGTAVSRTEYSDLFSVIGTQFGEGDGSTTFNLPDFSGLAPVGIDDSDTNFNAVGKTYGEKTHTLTKAETPSLTGSIQTRQQNDNNTIDIYPTGSAAESVFTYTKNGGDRWNNMGSGWAPSNSNNARIDFDNGGEDAPHNNIQPSIAMKFYIKAYQATATPAQVVDSLDGNSTTDAPSVHAVNQKLQKLTSEIQSLSPVPDYANGIQVSIEDGQTYSVPQDGLLVLTATNSDGEPSLTIKVNGQTISQSNTYPLNGGELTQSVFVNKEDSVECTAFSTITKAMLFPLSTNTSTSSNFDYSENNIILDANNTIETGGYYTNSTTINIPIVGGGGYLDVKKHTDTRINQTWINYKDNQIFNRQYNNINSGWGDWQLINSGHVSQVGDVIINSSSDYNPNNEFTGQTWELIDKEFSPTTSSNTGFNTSSDITTNSVRWSRSGHSLDFEFTFTSSAALTDEVIILGTLDYSVMGVERLNHTLRVVGSSDGANSLFILYINATTGEVQSVDSIGETTVAAGNSCYAFFSMNINPDFMLDSACNKFYWKRVS